MKIFDIVFEEKYDYISMSPVIVSGRSTYIKKFLGIVIHSETKTITSNINIEPVSKPVGFRS